MVVRQLALGPFSLNLGNRTLLLGDLRIELPGRAFDILRVLAEAQGRVVSKDELMSAVWPGRVVEENNIEVHVSALRKALARHAPDSNQIVTVPGQGYRLLQLTGPDGAAASSQIFLGASIAVLPFKNLSGDPTQEYFADGIAEDIITGLSPIKWLAVIARNSSFTYKGKGTDVKQVGKELGVRYVLDGGVRKVADRVRISAQLIDTSSGVQIWADRFDRVFDDIFAVQDELTAHVIGAIEPNLRKAEIERVRRVRPKDLTAYDLVLRALPHVHNKMVSGAEAAIPLLLEALEKEPGYALAQALLAQCYHFRFSRGGLAEEDRRKSVQLARAAIASGTDDATTLAVAGIVLWFDDHDVSTALMCFERALATSDSNVVALSNSAFVKAWMGDDNAAIGLAERAIKLSPFDTLNSHMALAIAYFSRADYAAACEAARRAVAASPTFSVPYALLAAALMRLGRPEAATKAIGTLRELDPTFTTGVWGATVGIAGDTYDAIAASIRELGIVE